MIVYIWDSKGQLLKWYIKFQLASKLKSKVQNDIECCEEMRSLVFAKVCLAGCTQIG